MKIRIRKISGRIVGCAEERRDGIHTLKIDERTIKAHQIHHRVHDETQQFHLDIITNI